MSSVKHRLTKSRFLSGLQCPRRLWWEVHEPEAPELQPDPGIQVLFDRGHRVGELARTYVPGGVLIDLPHHALKDRATATRRALADGAPAVFEAALMADGAFVSVDILERRRRGFALVEVKSTLDGKPSHIPDVAIQLHVARRAGLDVRRAFVMHLNRECRYPDLSNLFARDDVTGEVEEAACGIEDQIRSMLAVLHGPLPDEEPGPRCSDPHDCPFWDWCWPPLPEDHVSTLWHVGKRRMEKLLAAGHETILDLPRDYEASGPMARQIESVRKNKMVVRRSALREALSGLQRPVAYLDFETINPAIPVWPGCGPYHQVPVQMSCHVEGPDGLTHNEWLARGPGDPREDIARAVVEACRGAATIFAYSASFEKQCLAALAEAVPSLAHDLRGVSRRIVDMLPIVRDHVYHPAFGGSFGLKSVLPALVPDLGYDDLEIQDGGTASAALETLILDEEQLASLEREELRESLLRYCERDTLGMVRLHETLRAVGRL